MEYVIVFQNTNHAIKSETLLLDACIPAKVMPLPSQIREGCGICLRLEKESLTNSLAILGKNSIPVIVFERSLNRECELPAAYRSVDFVTEV